LQQAIIVAAGLTLIGLSYTSEEAVMRSRLLTRTVNAAEGLSPKLVRALTGEPGDVDLPAYQEVKRHLTSLTATNPDLHFSYLMGRRPDGTVVILADNEPPDSPDYSPPGDVYTEATREEHDVFDHGYSMVIGPVRDRWGVFVTGYVPVFDASGRHVLALFGLDINADAWRGQIIMKTLPQAVVFAILLSALVAFGYLLRRRHAAGPAAPLWTSRLEVMSVVVCGLLLTLFLCLYLERFEARQRRIKFEQLATSETDRIAERIRTIRDNHLVGMKRYFEASRVVTEREFWYFTSGLLDDPMIAGWAWLPRPGPDGQPRMATLVNPPPADGDPASDFADPGRSEAMTLAEQSGLPVGTRPEPVGTAGVYRMFIYTACRGQVPGLIRLALDVDAVDPHQDSNHQIHHQISLMHADGTVYRIDDAGKAGLHELELTRPVSAFGYTFLITAHQPGDAAGISDNITPLLALATGISITVGIAIMVGAPVRRREELQRLVNEQTREISEREQQFRLIAESMRDVVWVVDLERWTYTYISPSVKRLGGYSAEELLNQQPDFTLVDSQRDHLMAQLKARTADFMAGRICTENYFIDEILQRCRDGRVIWTETITSFTRNPVNGRLEIRGTTRDISERRQAESELQENRRFLSDLVENSGALIFVKNRDGIFTLVNRRWEAITGIPRDRALGRSDGDLFPDNLSAGFSESDQQVLQAGASWEQEECVTFNGETSWFFTIKFPLRDEKGEISGVCGISTDITRIKQSEERLRAQFEELQRWQDVMLNRESRIIELKNEVNRLCQKANLPPAYDHT
jgi:PAS domain S-box-containing protein